MNAVTVEIIIRIGQPHVWVVYCIVWELEVYFTSLKISSNVYNTIMGNWYDRNICKFHVLLPSCKCSLYSYVAELLI